jgi:hypothetical protein
MPRALKVEHIVLQSPGMRVSWLHVSHETPSSGSPSGSTKLSLRCKQRIDAPVREYLVAIATHLLVVKMSLRIRWNRGKEEVWSGYPANQRTRQEQRNDE